MNLYLVSPSRKQNPTKFQFQMFFHRGREYPHFMQKMAQIDVFSLLGLFRNIHRWYT